MNAALLAAARKRFPVIPTLGLAAAYDFVQGADPQVLYDSGPSLAHGTLGGTASVESTDPTWTAQGLTFDGANDYALLPSAPFNFGINPFTLVVAVTSPNASPGQFVVSQQSGGGIGSWELQLVSGRFTGRIAVAGGSSLAFNSAPVFANGQHILIATVTPTVDARAYLDGGDPNVQSLIGAAASNFSGNNNVYVGKRSIGTPFTGSVHYFSAYNRALFDGEARSLYRALRRSLNRRGLSF